MMKKIFFITFILGLLTINTAQARNIKMLLPINEALATAEAQQKLDGNIKFYFQGMSSPAVSKKLGTAASNKKTNAVGRSDEEACNRAFLSAMISLQERAQSLGANAVVKIVSYYKKQEYASAHKFECHAGNIMSGVALKGTFVKSTGNVQDALQRAAKAVPIKNTEQIEYNTDSEY